MRQAAVLVEASACFLQRLGAQVDAALRFRLQKAEALRRRIEDHSDHVIATHRHVAVVLPAQPLDGRPITAVRVDPLGRVNLADVTRPDLRRLREKIGDHLRSGCLAQAG